MARLACMKLRPWLALCALAMLVLATAVVAKEIETTATGTGADENAALADALAKAVSQVNGVRSSMDVSTGKLEMSGSASTTSAEGTTQSQARVEVGRTADARMRSQGTVSRYEVLNTETLPDGRVRMTVKAFIHRHEAPVYKAPGSAVARQRVAVFPANTSDTSYDFFGFMDGEEMASRLAAAIESSIMDTGQVALLDRRSLGASLVELGLVGSSLTNAGEKAKLRQFRGADIVVLTTVHEAYHRVHAWQLKSTGQHRSSVEMGLEVELRAVVPATGELLVSKRLRVDDAMGREDALGQVAAMAAYDVVRALTGTAPALPARRAPVREVERAPSPDTPRRSGIRLPGDR